MVCCHQSYNSNPSPLDKGLCWENRSWHITEEHRPGSTQIINITNQIQFTHHSHIYIVHIKVFFHLLLFFSYSCSFSLSLPSSVGLIPTSPPTELSVDLDCFLSSMIVQGSPSAESHACLERPSASWWSLPGL